jgi:hypothetical protein
MFKSNGFLLEALAETTHGKSQGYELAYLPESSLVQRGERIVLVDRISDANNSSHSCPRFVKPMNTDRNGLRRVSISWAYYSSRPQTDSMVHTQTCPHTTLTNTMKQKTPSSLLILAHLIIDQFRFFTWQSICAIACKVGSDWG